MKPSQPRQAGLVQLLDRLLDKGVILQADLLISLAGVPLIGVSLRAAVAAVETMLRYGIWEDWDAAVRAVARGAGTRAVRGGAPGAGSASAAAEPEQVIARFGGHVWWSRAGGSWVAAQIQITNRGVRASPGPPLPYPSIRSAAVVRVPGSKEGRGCVYLTVEDGSGVALLVEDPQGLRRLIQDRVQAAGKSREEVVDHDPGDPCRSQAEETRQVVARGGRVQAAPAAAHVAGAVGPGRAGGRTPAQTAGAERATAGASQGGCGSPRPRPH